MNEYSEKNLCRWTLSRDLRGYRCNSMHDLVNLISDIRNQDAILSVTILKPCKKCGHACGDHVKERQCKIKGCSCDKFE